MRICWMDFFKVSLINFLSTGLLKDNVIGLGFISVPGLDISIDEVSIPVPWDVLFFSFIVSNNTLSFHDRFFQFYTHLNFSINLYFNGKRNLSQFYYHWLIENSKNKIRNQNHFIPFKVQYSIFIQVATSAFSIHCWGLEINSMIFWSEW